MNCTRNTSLADQNCKRLGNQSSSFGSLQVTQITLLVVISVIGTFGNTLTIFTLLKKKNRVKSSSIILLDLAVCDFLISAVCIPVDLGQLFTGQWIYGTLSCKLIYPFQTALPIVSSWTLLFMFFERYLIFSKQINAILRSNTIRVLAVTTWFLALVLVIPYSLHLHARVEDHVILCEEQWRKSLDRKVYTVVLSTFEFVLPMNIVLFFVIKINKWLKEERQTFQKNNFSVNKRTRRRRLKTNKKIMITFIVMVIVYAFLKLPNNIFWQVVEFGTLGSSLYFTTIWAFVGLCSYSTSVTNPIVLVIMSSEFRADFKSLLLCKCFTLARNWSQTYSASTLVEGASENQSEHRRGDSLPCRTELSQYSEEIHEKENQQYRRTLCNQTYHQSFSKYKPLPLEKQIRDSPLDVLVTEDQSLSSEGQSQQRHLTTEYQIAEQTHLLPCFSRNSPN